MVSVQDDQSINFVRGLDGLGLSRMAPGVVRTKEFREGDCVDEGKVKWSKRVMGANRGLTKKKRKIRMQWFLCLDNHIKSRQLDGQQQTAGRRIEWLLENT